MKQGFTKMLPIFKTIPEIMHQIKVSLQDLIFYHDMVVSNNNYSLLETLSSDIKEPIKLQIYTCYSFTWCTHTLDTSLNTDNNVSFVDKFMLFVEITEKCTKRA